MAKTREDKSRKDEFGEFMPAYMDTYDLFPAREREELVEKSSAEEADAAVRAKMIRQLLVLVGLLILQFLLFAFLLQSTVNLG